MKLSPVLLILIICQSISAQQKLTQYVDPFVGTGGHGHTFPGATRPFGMVQLSPDTRLSGWDGCSGYHYSDHIIYGFSHTHLSGTGVSDYGDILLMPTAGSVHINATNGGQTDKGYASRFSHKTELAEPGYYAARLEDENIFVELTTTKRAGLHRYTYPATKQANIILDLQHRDKVVNSYLKIIGGRSVVGWRRSEGWAKDQVVYFAAEFSQPFTSSGIALNDEVRNGLKQAQGTNVKAFFTFDALGGAPILVRVGISAVSVAGAVKNLAAEISHWDFAKIKQDSDQAWNTELNKIQISGGTEAQRKNFYTALYHTMIAPNLFMDVDGKYRGRDFSIHSAKGFENYTVFSLWDTFRATHPLYTIIDQKRTADFINTFLAQYDQGGRLPVWELAANETDTMIGYHAVSVIADAAVKKVGGFDREKAFAAMKHSAELKHFGLDAYLDHGFIGLEEEKESVSRTLEYAYNDWCIAEMARLLGRPADYQRFLERAQSYRNVFDRGTRFMRPRSNGNWLTPFEPREVDFNFTEANSWQYSFFVPQDVSGLIELMGGKQKFAQKLDEMFAAESRTTGREQPDITGLIGQYAHGNEPSHHMAYLYNYVNQPWKTQARVRQIMDLFYQPTPGGLIGNEDCGQMSAWYVLSAAGFYSVTPGSPNYVIGSPLFPEVRFNLENGKSFVVKARGVSEQNLYIQSASLNGREYRKSYISHTDLMSGGELAFEMGPRPNQAWGSKDDDVPLSSIPEPKIIPVPVVRSASKSFKGLQAITIEPADPRSELNIHYTTDGSEPSSQSPRFLKPFFINRSTTVKALAIDSSGRKSLVVTATYSRIPHNWSITLLSKYSSQYTGGGDLALIDAIRGTRNWSGGGWQGYQAQDFVGVVDLGEVKSISQIGVGFLQDIRSWIWFPTRVEFETSLDGLAFTQASTVFNEIPDRADNVRIQDLRLRIKPRDARYIRIRARSLGKVPSWHPGSGGDSWIFVDEILVH